MPVSLPFALLGAQLVSAPLLLAANIEPTCKNAGASSVGLGGSDGCLRSEREAKGTLEREWGRFNAPARAQCSQQSDAGGLPSYVELLTCLELASGTVPTTAPQNGATGGQGSPGAGAPRRGGEEGSALTREPSPSQRTDPVQTLGKPAQ